jgi:hypothetical protein
MYYLLLFFGYAEDGDALSLVASGNFEFGLVELTKRS